MEMMKIRKGNDIRLKVQLKLNTPVLEARAVTPVGGAFQDMDENEYLNFSEVYHDGNNNYVRPQHVYTGASATDYASNEYANIQSIRAIFINTTLRENLERAFIKKNRFIGRFPIEPFVHEFEPTAYNIHSMGYARNRVFVHTPYQGFGLHPNWNECLPVHDTDYTRYFAPVSSTTDPRVKIVDFPAQAQLTEGVYQLVIVAKVFDPGYNNNLRTVTVNYNNVFEIVKDSKDATDSPVQIEINSDSNLSQLQDVYVISGHYSDNDVRLRRNDNSVINVDISPITSWYEGE